MIKIKFEVKEEEEEEEVTSLPIENENEQIKELLSLNFCGNSNNNSGLSSTNLNNVTSIDNMVTKKLPAVVPMKMKKLKPKQLDNSTTDSVAVCSKSIKTEPAESSLSLTTQLNNSLNIQSLLRQNRIQNGWTTNEQSIPIGTQQQQSFLSTKIEPIVSEILQEVPLSLNQSSSLIPNGTQQQQQSLFLPKIEPIVADIHQEIPLFLDQNASNSNSLEITTTTNCDTTTEMFLGPRASLGRRAKLNVCYSVPMEPKPVPRRQKKVSMVPTPTPEPEADSAAPAGNSESINNNDNDQYSGSGSISGLDPSSASSTSSTTTEVAALSAVAAVPLLVGNKPLSRAPPLTSLEEKRKALKKERDRHSYLRQKAKPIDPEVKAEKLRKKREYRRKLKEQRLANATPEQRELIREKESERFKRQREKESEEQRQLRLEQVRQYDRTVGNQRKKQKRSNWTPEEREKKRAINREYRKRKKMMKKQLESQTLASDSNRTTILN